MKKSLVLLVAIALSTQAAQIRFALSPPGTDVAVGLSPSNEVPRVSNSAGSGDAIGDGIVFDTDTSILHLTVAYGSAAGFTDLSGVATSMHIHGPAPTGEKAGVLIDLITDNVPATNPAAGGVIHGDIAFPSDSVLNLLAGLTYLNIHTLLNPGGEIRGQLISASVTNGPPSVSCPTNSTVECGSATIVSALVSDNEGGLLVVWILNGVGVQTNSLPGSGSAEETNVALTSVLPLGTNGITVTVMDAAGNFASCSTTITVVDDNPPVISSAAASPDVLWPPNNKMRPVSIQAQVNGCGPTTWKIISVQSSEASKAKGIGHTSSDWEITGDHTLKLRAERSGQGAARLYAITIEATDLSGNFSQTTVTVKVPHSNGRGPARGQVKGPKTAPPGKGNKG